MKIHVSITRQENAEFFNAAIGDVVEVEFEDYVAAVVASEIGNSPLEACKAQAIAARTFAINRGVLKGKTISDASSTAQAYRAKRNNPAVYPNSIQGTKDTAGLVLYYNGKPIDAVYSANNGGRTTSSRERWGNTCVYLIAQDDPWDAADGQAKRGHGVGLSQRGAMYAASNGADFKQILSFYYPNTVIMTDYGNGKEVKPMANPKADDIVTIAKSKLGDPYVFGAWGDPCTPSKRKQYAGYHPEYRSNIYNACPVLSGKQSSCSGCKWEGHLCYDCRGFSHYCVLNGSGIDVEGGGATSQYNEDKNWDEKGLLKNAPNLVFCVFKKKDAKMSHTGIHIGNGQIIHCSTIVKEGLTTDSGWTHYAIPKGLYTLEEIKNAERLNPKEVSPVSYNPETEGFLYKAKVTASSGGSVNMRSSASTGASIVTKIPIGTNVYVIEEYNSAWSKICHNGTTGYMMSKFLNKISENPVVEPITDTDGDDVITISKDLAEQLYAVLKSQLNK